MPLNATTRLALAISSGLGSGYVPVAPGTAGTVVALPLYFWLSPMALPVRLGIIGLLTVVGIIAAQRAGLYYREPDSGHIVIDEIAGYLWATALIPFSWPAMLIAFVFFRIFDVVKPWPANYFDQQVKNGFGVVADDLVAGIYAGLATFAALKLI